MNEIITQLSKSLPDEAIQRTKGVETHKGYDTTGYGYQYVADRFNDVLGLEWGFSYQILDVTSGKYQDKEYNGRTVPGKPFISITVDVSIYVQDKKGRPCAGGHTSSNYADALKGAITNGFKKAAAFWGVGRDAFAGTIDDDNKPLPDKDENKVEQVKSLFNGTNANPPVDIMKMKTKDLSEYAKNYFRELKYTLPEVYWFAEKHGFDNDKIDTEIKSL